MATRSPSDGAAGARSADTVERVAFLLRLRADRVDDYLDAHETVWPEMLAALTEAGWRNYSLFLHREQSLIVGYVETDDFVSAQARLTDTASNTAWQNHMAEYFDPPTGGVATRLPQYFHLD